ncbi:hypothetical protein CEXT_357801 [Caerostris extrusa]|uniref:Ig-like domain-containing protein n=1 Tax=Caerostris extrusa TaxID=172846 RepID=A0AAV4SIZ6_CAEEX|nr:hypothetical protein CEXT_357801 [Caerostris extrusa]
MKINNKRIKLFEPIRVSVFLQNFSWMSGRRPTQLFHTRFPCRLGDMEKGYEIAICQSEGNVPTPTSLQVRQVKRQDSGIYQCFVNRKSFLRRPAPDLSLVVEVYQKREHIFESADQRAMFPTPTSLQVRQVKRQDSGLYQCLVNRKSFVRRLAPDMSLVEQVGLVSIRRGFIAFEKENDEYDLPRLGSWR